MTMTEIERDRIEATLPRDRKYRMPPEMSNAMRAAAFDRFHELSIASMDGRIGWEDVCAICCAVFEAKSAEPPPRPEPSVPFRKG